MVFVEATGGFEPPNRGFADPRLRPLGYVALLSWLFSGASRWCRGGDSNSHSLLGHSALNAACLPIPPPRPGRFKPAASRARSIISTRVKRCPESTAMSVRPIRTGGLPLSTIHEWVVRRSLESFATVSHHVLGRMFGAEGARFSQELDSWSACEAIGRFGWTLVRTEAGQTAAGLLTGAAYRSP